MGGAPAWDLHRGLDLHVKLGVATCAHPTLGDVVSEAEPYVVFAL